MTEMIFFRTVILGISKL